MEEKVKKYVNLISDISEWSDLLTTKKLEMKNIFSSLVEKNIELDDSSQMREILSGIKDGLTTNEIMLYVESGLLVSAWNSIRKAIKRGVPLERIKPILNSRYSTLDLMKIEKEYFKEKEEENKKRFIELMFSE